MTARPITRLLLPLAAATGMAGAHAVQVCELNGEWVNPANGNTTAGKTGMMRCREGENGPLQREQELQAGRFVGVQRFYRDGVLQKDQRVNERGNRDGLSREYAATPGAENRLLREETVRDGTTVGLVRSWHAAGGLRRASFHGDDGREQASAEFTAAGKLSDLRCAPKPVLAPGADDTAWCGHRGVATVDLHNAKGDVVARLTHEAGERRRSETLWENGRTRELTESRADAVTQRSYSAEGTLRREQQWVLVGVSATSRGQRVPVLDREMHESGTPARERRWQPGERGSRLRSEHSWYQNGQPREQLDWRDDGAMLLARSFHDNGKLASEGNWRVVPREGRIASGVHRSHDEQGRVRLERHHDEQGRVNRERELDETGRVLRDDELFPDGSRKSTSAR